MQSIWHHVRYALRQLRKSPGFTLTVLLTLALGVGANAIVFSVLNALVLRPLPVPHPEQMVFLNRLGTPYAGSSSGSTPSQSYPDYVWLRDGNRTFAGLSGYRLVQGGVRAGDSVSQSWFYEASENYFDTLGLRPALGRFFHPSDAHGVNSSPYLVLSYGYWQRHFNGDRTIVGRVVELNKHPYTVLGVAPESFGGTEIFVAPDFWVPMANQPELDGYNALESRSNHSTWVIGRLKPGASLAQGEGDLNALAAQMSKAYPQDDESLSFRLSRPGLIGDTLGKPIQAFLYGVLALAALVLLAACANLGGLFAARAADRARELAVRLALGATRGMLMRQMVTEAVLVSLVGGLLGLLLASAAAHALTLWRPSAEFPIQVAVQADWRVSTLALLLAVLSGLFFGLVPVRQVWRRDAYAAIKSGTASPGSGRRWTLRDALLVVQIVLCSLLLTSSLVAVRGLVRSLHTSYGFKPQDAMLANFDLRMVGYKQEEALPFERRVMDKIAALPGVTFVGLSDRIPLSLSTNDTAVYRDGTTDFRDSNSVAEANTYRVSPRYLQAAGTRLLAGRDFTWHDDDHAPKVAIVNQTFARKVLGTATSEALGRSFILRSQRFQVIGLVEDGKYLTITEDPAATAFLPTAAASDTRAILVVRSHLPEAEAAAAVHGVLAALDPSLPLTIGGWPEAMSIALFPSIAATCALGVMGGLAAMLAITGIFGTASYAVSKRLRELALRVALGAQRGQVLQAALGRPARLLLGGSCAGIALGAMAARLLSHIVYQATSQDPLVLAGVVAAMALLALLATWLPARRVLHVDPASLLREE